MDSYEKTEWHDGMLPSIDENNLNKIEDGIYANREKLKGLEKKYEINTSGNGKLTIEYGSDSKFHLSVDDNELVIESVDTLTIKTSDSGADPNNPPRIEIDKTGVRLYGNVSVNDVPI